MPFGADIPDEEVPVSAHGATVVNLAGDPFAPVGSLRVPEGEEGEMDDQEDYEELLAQALGDEDEDEDEDAEPAVTSDLIPSGGGKASRSATGTPARTLAAGKANTPASTTVKASAISGRKRKAETTATPSSTKRGRPARAAGSAARQAITDGAAKKPAARGRPAPTGVKGKRGRPKLAKANGAEAEEAGDEWEVEEVLDDMIAEDYQHVFLVKWKGYPASDNTWEPQKNLQHATSLVKAYEAKKKKDGKSTRGRKPKKA